VELELTIENKETGEVNVQRLPIEDRVALGRGPESPVALDGPLISREHVAFEIVGESLCVADLSSNGSWLNGEQLKPGRRYPVTEIDRVQVPGYELRPVLLGAPELAAPPAEPSAPPPNPVRSFLASITATETTVLLVFVAAVAITVVFLKL
jgi:predicted component of type VI protein secretion system